MPARQGYTYCFVAIERTPGQLPGCLGVSCFYDLVEVWKTLSVPEMVTNEKVHDAYMKRIASETDKMIDRYYEMLVD